MMTSRNPFDYGLSGDQALRFLVIEMLIADPLVKPADYLKTAIEFMQYIKAPPRREVEATRLPELMAGIIDEGRRLIDRPSEDGMDATNG